MKQLYDVIIIGGGVVVGSAIARGNVQIPSENRRLEKRTWMFAMRPAAGIPVWSMAGLLMTQVH